MRTFPALVMAAGALLLAATSASARPVRSTVVGTWLIEEPAAPFPLHMYVFNADGTMQQANPDAGDPQTSDSDGKGVWAMRGDHVIGKWVEILADRTTRKLAGRGELSFDLLVTGNRLTGTARFVQFDAAGQQVQAYPPDQLTGSRVTLP